MFCLKQKKEKQKGFWMLYYDNIYLLWYKDDEFDFTAVKTT